MATRPESAQQQVPAVGPAQAGDTDGATDPDTRTAVGQQADTVTMIVDLTEQKGPARRFYANLADL
ncbi:MAG: hypothetical protein M0Z30_06260 [Actinomycetota bacterium]|nr:hypothetical protein [Actinomycetota bacterium]